MEEQLSFKAQELLNSFKKAEAKWTEEISQKNDFIRRRDHTIATQIDTINSMSKEVLDLTQKNKKLEDETKDLLIRLSKDKAEQERLTSENTLLAKRVVDAKKEADAWKTKYNNLKSSWKEECKRRVDTFSDDENTQVKKKVARSD